MELWGKHIFIVEDNVHNRVIYQIILSKSGARLEFDRYGRDTLSVLKQQVKVDLIILDMMLPKGDSGFDIFENIRTEPEFAKTPIVAVSASDVSEAMPRARKMGFSGYIAKPINQLIFPAQLARIIAGEEVWYAADKYGNE